MNRSASGRPFGGIVRERADRAPAFASALLEDAVKCLLAGDLAVARRLIRDAIKGSMGYAALSRRTGTPEKSLVRMFGPSGNPTAVHLGRVLRELQRHGSVRLRVVTEPLGRRQTARTAAVRRAAAVRGAGLDR